MPVGGQAAPVAGAAEGRRRRGDDAEGEAVRKPEPLGRRPVYFDEFDGAVDTPIYARDTLSSGMSVAGPAIIEQLDSTTVVPPGVKADIDPWLNIRMHISGER